MHVMRRVLSRFRTSEGKLSNRNAQLSSSAEFRQTRREEEPTFGHAAIITGWDITWWEGGVHDGMATMEAMERKAANAPADLLLEHLNGNGGATRVDDHALHF
jgi:hypothetical protein